MGLFSKKVKEEPKVEEIIFDHKGLRSEFTEISKDLYNGRHDPGFQRLWKAIRLFRDIKMLETANLPFATDEKTLAYNKGIVAGMTIFMNTLENQMKLSLASEQKGEVKKNTKKKIWSSTNAGPVV
jgi:hypothetical protein